MLLLLAALSVGTIGTSAGHSPQSVGPLSYLIGTWRVLSTDAAGGGDLRVCYSVRPFAGAKWLSGEATSRTPSFGSKDVWGVAGASGELIRTIFDTSGTYAVVRSPGWKGDVMILEGDARSNTGTLRVRETIQRLSKDRFSATWEALRGRKWSVYAIETATRVPTSKCSLSQTTGNR
jgi:hypothetical protein